MTDNYQTERLLLSKLTSDDAVFMHELLNTPDWIENIGDRNIHSPEAAHAYILKITSPEFSSAGCIWKVLLRESHTPVGIITLTNKEYLTGPDIGFAFLPHYTGRGYAYEAARAVITIARQHNIRDVVAVTIKENLRSQKLLAKLGLKQSGTVIADKKELILFSLSE